MTKIDDIFVRPKKILWLTRNLPTSLLMGIGIYVFTNLTLPSFVLPWFICCSCLFFILICYDFLCINNDSWKINDEEILFIHGVFDISYESTKLFRIKDICLKQNLYEQILCLARLEIISTDSSAQKMTIYGIDLHDSFRLKKYLDEKCREQRRETGIIELGNI